MKRVLISILTLFMVATMITTVNAATGSIMDLINIPNVILMLALYYFTAKCKKTKGLHAAAFIAASALIGIVFRLGGV